MSQNLLLCGHALHQETGEDRPNATVLECLPCVMANTCCKTTCSRQQHENKVDYMVLENISMLAHLSTGDLNLLIHAWLDQQTWAGDWSTCSAGWNFESNSAGTPSSRNPVQNNPHGNRSRGFKRKGRGNDERSPEDKSKKSRTSTGPRFACHFYKFDPIAHLKCVEFRGRNISDVQRHLTRTHGQPKYYCPRCGTVFRGDGSAAETEFDTHTEARACEVSAIEISFPGLPREVLNQIAAVSNSANRASLPERWYMIWDIIYTGAEHPESPYIDWHSAAQLFLDLGRAFDRLHPWLPAPTQAQNSRYNLIYHWIIQTTAVADNHHADASNGAQALGGGETFRALREPSHHPSSPQPTRHGPQTEQPSQSGQHSLPPLDGQVSEILSSDNPEWLGDFALNMAEYDFIIPGNTLWDGSVDHLRRSDHEGDEPGSPSWS